MSVTFVTGNEMSYLRTIENLTKKQMSPLRPPTTQEAFRGQLANVVEVVKALTEVDNTDMYQDAITYLSENYTEDEIALALVRSLVKDPSSVKVEITPERPLPNRNKRNFHRNASNRKHNGGNRDRNGKGGYKGNAKDKNRNNYDRKKSYGGNKQSKRKSAEFKIR